MTDHELLAAFEKCSLSDEQWNHRAHVRIAYMYVSQGDLFAALDRMRAGIKAFNKVSGTAEAIDQGYHETMTQAFMVLIFHANSMTGPHVSSDDFCACHPELLSKSILRQFYSRERIMTWTAKSEFVEPDLKPLPYSGK